MHQVHTQAQFMQSFLPIFKHKGSYLSDTCIRFLFNVYMDQLLASNSREPQLHVYVSTQPSIPSIIQVPLFCGHVLQTKAWIQSCVSAGAVISPAERDFPVFLQQPKMPPEILFLGVPWPLEAVLWWGCQAAGGGGQDEEVVLHRWKYLPEEVLNHSNNSEFKGF